MKFEKEDFLKGEIGEKFKSFADEMYNMMVDKALKAGDISERRAEIVRRRYKLDAEEVSLKEQLDSVTHNTYEDIGEMLNDMREQHNKVIKDTYEKIKKYLDDNNLPYEENEEDEDEEVQD